MTILIIFFILMVRSNFFVLERALWNSVVHRKSLNHALLKNYFILFYFFFKWLFCSTIAHGPTRRITSASRWQSERSSAASTPSWLASTSAPSPCLPTSNGKLKWKEFKRDPIFQPQRGPSSHPEPVPEMLQHRELPKIAWLGTDHWGMNFCLEFESVSLRIIREILSVFSKKY